MPFKVVELVRHPFQFLFSLGFRVSQRKHVFVIGADKVNQLIIICLFLILLFCFIFTILNSLFLKLPLFCVYFSL